MRRYAALILTIPALLLLAGCTNPGSPSPSPTPSPSQTAKATTLDPCQLVTADEASALSGVTFGPGVESITGSAGTGKRCDYGSNTANVFYVQVGVSASPAAAQADWATEEAEADANIAAGFPGQWNANFTKTDLTGIGDRAAVGTGSETIEGKTISGGILYLLKGPNFLGFGELTLGTAPTADALKAQALVSLDRMP